MTWEAAQGGTDARRALHARLILEHRLSKHDPLAVDEDEWQREAAEILFSERSVTIGEIAGLLVNGQGIIFTHDVAKFLR